MTLLLENGFAGGQFVLAVRWIIELVALLNNS